jgi:thioredoxin 1
MAAAAMSLETIAAAATSALGTRRLRHPPAFLSFRFRPTPRLPGVVAVSAPAFRRRSKAAKAHDDGDHLGNFL